MICEAPLQLLKLHVVQSSSLQPAAGLFNRAVSQVPHPDCVRLAFSSLLVGFGLGIIDNLIMRFAFVSSDNSPKSIKFQLKLRIVSWTIKN